MSEVEIEKPIDRSWPQYLEERFTPNIANSLEEANFDVHNCVQIEVDLSSSSLLDFTAVKEQVEKVLKKGFLLFFAIDLRLSKTYSCYFDEVQFESIRYGLKIFQEQILKPFLSKVFGIGFPFGKLSPAFSNSPFVLDKIKEYLQVTYPNFEEHFGFYEESFVDQLDQPHVRKEIALYQVGLIAEYLHRLASTIQDPIEMYAFFDFEGFSDLEVLQFISQERFPYIRIGLVGCSLSFQGMNVFSGNLLGGNFCLDQNIPTSPKIGLVFPTDQKLTSHSSVEFERLLAKIRECKIPFFVLYEDFMTENWQNLEQIIVHAQFVDRNTKRKCQGFVAAQGAVVTFGGEIGIYDEQDFSVLEQ